MATAKREHDWSIASSQMALLAEVNRNHKKRPQPFRPMDFNPMATKPAVAKLPIEEAAAILGIKLYPKKPKG